MALGFALGFGLAARTGDPRLGPRRVRDRGGAGACSGLHNDCRYKAFFQRLKSSSATYRVDGRQRREARAAGTLAAGMASGC